jgi:hypothetical protein
MLSADHIEKWEKPGVGPASGFFLSFCAHYLGGLKPKPAFGVLLVLCIPQGRNTMKGLVSMIVALGLAVAFTAPTFAADPPATKADCEKAKMKWDDAAKKCS